MVKALAIAVALAAVACHRDPNVAYAHQLERAASWSASVQFAGELARQHDVPQTYLDDVLSTAAREVGAICGKIETDENVPANRRSADSSSCRRLTSVLQAAGRAGSITDDGLLRDIEMQLRVAAQRARSAAPQEARR